MPITDVNGGGMAAFDYDELPIELARNRVLSSVQAAAFLGLSVAHFRRLYRRHRALRPVRLGERRLGWRLGDLIRWIEAGGTQPSGFDDGGGNSASVAGKRADYYE